MKIRQRGASTRRCPIFSRALLAAAISCFYVSFSGESDMVEEYNRLGGLLSLGNGEAKIEGNLQLVENPPSSSRTLQFPGYPLTRESMKAVGASLGRSAVPVFQPKQWCQLRPKPTTHFMIPQANETEGVFYVKTPKTGSQTINRILKRLVSRVARNQHHSEFPCYFRGHHIQGNPAVWYSHRIADHSVLLTSLRDPAPRALSRVYWTFSTRRVHGRVTVDVLKQSLKRTDVETGCVSEGQGGFQLNYVSFPTIDKNSAWNPDQPNVVQNAAQIHDHVQQVLRDYDFILVQERLEESLVALQLLMGLETADILSMPLHVGGSYLYDRLAGCLELFSPPRLPHLYPDQPEESTNNITSSLSVEFLDAYFQSPTWYAQNYGDYVLLGAAEAILDQTIQDLGSKLFEAELQKFRALQKGVLEVCSKQVVFPCSETGTIQREDYAKGSPTGLGDRYPQQDIEDCIDEVVQAQR